MAILTFDINIRQEMHLYFPHSASFTYLTSSSFGIKAESSWSISSLYSFLAFGEYFPYMSENSCICGYVGMRSPSNWRLIYYNYLIQLIGSLDFLDLSDRMNGRIKSIQKMIG
jgi:hypothetical protein